MMKNENDKKWISQDKLQHLLWSLLLFWVFLLIKDKIHYFGVNDFTKFKEQVEKCSKLKFYKGNNKPIYTLVQANWMT